MKKFLTTTAMASALAFPAMADDTDIDQTIEALQVALNSILINFDGDTISQAATNAGNLISYATDDLDDVTQTIDDDFDQLAVNSLISTGGTSGGVFTGAFDDVDQAATNVANSIDALTLEDLDQSIDDATQTAINDISGPTGVSDFDQSAVNAGNLATLVGVENDIDQDIDDTVQSASNSATSDFGTLTMGVDNGQAATNVVNSATLTAAIDDDLMQDVDDSIQDATNDLSSAGGIDTFDQSAVNAANLATLVSVGDDTNQDVDDLAQAAANVATSEGAITAGAQAATNVANSLNVSGAVDDDVIQSVSEFFNIQPVSQTASNLADADLDITDLTQDAVNAANLATVDSIGDNLTQYAFDLDQDASNVAFAFFGDIDNVDQAATNVVNSLDIAGDIGGNLSQTFAFSSQTSANTLDGVFSIDGSTQAAVNAANLATSVNGVGGSVTQTIGNGVFLPNVTQTASNDALVVVGSVTNTDQDATNVGNSLSGDAIGGDFTVIDQSVIDTTQIASNNIGESPVQGNVVTAVDTVNQTAVNAANLATIDDVSVSLTQSMVGTGQLAVNTVVDVDASSGGISALAQAATNVGNSVTMDDIKPGASLTQVADMSGFLNGQAAINYVEFGQDGMTGVTQAATNAVNLVTLDALQGTLSQTVINGAQIAGNLGNYSGFIGDGGPNLDSQGLVSGLDQTAVNAANLVTVNTLPDLLGTTEVTQAYTGFQLAGNGLYDADTINNVTQAATNVVNSISN